MIKSHAFQPGLVLDETISNDPADESEDFLKSWQLPLGSIRPVDHDKFKSIEVNSDRNKSMMKWTVLFQL